MIFDLGVMTALGFLLDLFAVKFGGVVFNIPMYAAFSLLIVFLAVLRWEFWGLLTAPFMALATFLGGANMDYFRHYAMMYDWRMYISICVALMSFAVNVPILKKIGTKKITSQIWSVVLLMFVDYLIVCGVHALTYGLLTLGCSDDYLKIVVTYSNGPETYYRRFLGEMAIMYNLFGLAIMIIGGIILRSQGVLCNAKEKLIDDKRNAELDRQFEKFTIDDSACEDASGETESQKSDEIEGE